MKTFDTFKLIVIGAICGTLLLVIQVSVSLFIASCVNLDVVQVTDVRYTDEGVTCYEIEYDIYLDQAILNGKAYDLLFNDNDYEMVKSVTIEPIVIK